MFAAAGVDAPEPMTTIKNPLLSFSSSSAGEEGIENPFGCALDTCAF
jgi:hypothetical protein